MLSASQYDEFGAEERPAAAAAATTTHRAVKTLACASALVGAMCVVASFASSTQEGSAVDVFNKAFGHMGGHLAGHHHGQNQNQNECRGEGRGSDCSPKAMCIDYFGGYHGYECVCEDGYTGNGRWCSEISPQPHADRITTGIVIDWGHALDWGTTKVHIMNNEYSYSVFAPVGEGAENFVYWHPKAAGIYKFKLQFMTHNQWSTWGPWSNNVRWTKTDAGMTIGALARGKGSGLPGRGSSYMASTFAGAHGGPGGL